MRVRHLLDDERDDADRADEQREDVGHVLAEDAIDEAVAESTVLGGERADVLVAEHDECEPAEDQHAGERHDEGGYADERHPEALPRADDRADEQRQHDREPPGQAPGDGEDARARADEGRDRADRQVDVAGDDDHHHADREDEDVPVLHDEVGDVLRAQDDAVREEREQRDDGDQRDEDAVLAEVGQHVADPVREFVLGRVDVRADGGGRVF